MILSFKKIKLLILNLLFNLSLINNLFGKILLDNIFMINILKLYAQNYDIS